MAEALIADQANDLAQFVDIDDVAKSFCEQLHQNGTACGICLVYAYMLLYDLKRLGLRVC